jgi:D-xylose 1-dehydrogenase
MPELSYAGYPSLGGRPVFVSGGASGIGEAIVRAFAAQQARVGFVDILEEAGSRLAQELNESGCETLFVPADVTDIATLRRAIAKVAQAFGAIRVLVNNAANDTRHDWRTETPETWDARIAVNLKHYFFAIQAVAPGMIEAGGGSIVNFSSISWMVGSRDLPIYMTAKAGTVGLTRSLARELGKHRIRVNTVLPGWVMTKRQLELWVDEDAEQLLDERQCLPDRLKPHDLARMTLFLAADDSAMCTSQEFIVDGGWA